MFGVDDLVTGGLISGLGSTISSLFNFGSTQATNEENARQAQLNRDFQAQMSNTAYQRGMADMKAAGLNPILAYQKGGASSPSGSTATMVAPQIDTGIADKALGSAMALRRSHQELDNMMETQTNIRQDTAKKIAETDNIKADTAIRTQNLSAAELEALKAKSDSVFYGSSAGKAARVVGTAAQEGMRTLGPVADLVGTGVSSALRAKQLKPQRSTSERSTVDSSGKSSSSFEERFHY